MAAGALKGRRVVVLGAGLAGLAAARDLEADGAAVTVFEARDRVGGRVHTMRGGFAEGQHAEAGADLIDGDQSHVRGVAEELGLDAVRILRRGWGFYGADRRGRPSVQSGAAMMGEVPVRLKREIADYTLAGHRWDSAIAAAIGRRSVADWLDASGGDAAFRARIRALRGFFLADPEDLSLLALVDQFASSGSLGDTHVFRLAGGNDTLPAAIARALRTKVKLGHVARRIRRTGAGVVVTVEHRSVRHEIQADACVSALPASTLRDVRFEPALPVLQHRAIVRLKYGPATRMLLQFERRFWRRAARPSAFASDRATGAVWDGNEEQGGGPGILSLLAGGRAAGELRAMAAVDGAPGITRRLAWMGTPAPLLYSALVSWDDDPWVKGGYAVFDPAFDPALRPWLARPAGCVVFAGEHTSERWQGYMNGAIETGRRAAAEVRAIVGQA